jgi:polar amino acid transport system substrate-binding protein
MEITFMRTSFALRTIRISAFSLLMSCSFAFAQGESDALLASMRKAGEAKIAIAAAPPWAYLSPSGQAQGYLVEVTAHALKAMGIEKLAPTVTTWDAMIPGLQARRFDLVPAGLLITSARCKVVAFSAPITAQQDALYVIPGNPKRLNGYATVASAADVKLAVLTGSSQEAYALAKGVKPEQLVRVPDIQAGVATVVAGRANAFAVGQFSIQKPGERGVEVVVDRQAPISSIAIAFRKEDARFRDAFNKQLEAMRSTGVMKNLYAAKYAMPNWDTLAKVTQVKDVVSDCE